MVSFHHPHTFLHALAVGAALWGTTSEAVRRTIEVSENPDLIYNARLQKCPQACQFTGLNTADWTTYTNLPELELCDETVLFSFNVQTLASDLGGNMRIKACSTSGKGPSGLTSGQYRAAYFNTSDPDSLPLDKPLKIARRQQVENNAEDQVQMNSGQRHILWRRDQNGSAERRGAPIWCS